MRKSELRKLDPEMQVRHYFAGYIDKPLDKWKAWIDDREMGAVGGVVQAFHHVAMNYIIDTAAKRDLELQRFQLLMWRSYIDNWLKVRKLKTATGRRLKASMENRTRKVFKFIENNRRLFKGWPDMSRARADFIIRKFDRS